MMASRFSFAPFGEPGKVTTIDLLLTPAVGRDIIATAFPLVSYCRVPRRATDKALLIAKLLASHERGLGLACAVREIQPILC